MNAKVAVSIEQFEELLARVQKLEEQVNKQKGLASTREMTDEDARRVLAGDLAKTSHKEAAEKLGLSYGQVYSARGGYTFKHIAKEVGYKQ